MASVLIMRKTPQLESIMAMCCQVTTSTIPTAAKRKEIIRNGPSSLCVKLAHRGTLARIPEMECEAFEEIYATYRLGRALLILEIGSFDNYIIPRTQKLKE
jgi:hypothetical protein